MSKTQAEFEAAYAEASGMTVEQLYGWGHHAAPCDCGHAWCEGWSMEYPKEPEIVEAWVCDKPPPGVPYRVIHYEWLKEDTLVVIYKIQIIDKGVDQ